MKEVNNEEELCSWFEDNFKDLGYDKIKRRNKRSFPDYIMIKDGEEVRVEIETVLSHFNYHNHNLDGVDDVVCIEEDVKLPLNVISLDDISFKEILHKNIGVRKEAKKRFNLVFYKDIKPKDDEKDMTHFLLALLDCWRENGSFEKYLG